MRDPLSWHQLSEGMYHARRIIRDAETFAFAGEQVVFDADYKRLALAALDAIEHDATLWRVHHEVAKWRERRKAEIHDVEVAIGDGRG